MRDYTDVKEKFKKVKPYLIFLVVPVVMVLILGSAMKPVFVEEVPFAIIDFDRTYASEKLTEAFEESTTFKIVGDITKIDEMEEEILYGNIQGGIIIPKGFSNNVKSKKGGDLPLIINGENMVIGNNIQAQAWKILNMANAKVQMKFLQAGGMSREMVDRSVYTLNLAERTLFNPTSGYLYYLFPVLLAAFVQQTILATVPNLLIDTKKRIISGNNLNEFKYVAGNLLSYILCSFASTIICMIILNSVFEYPLIGDLKLIFIIQGVFLLAITGPTLLISTVFDDTTSASQFTLFLTVPTVLTCGYAWPEFVMTPLFAASMKAIWPLYYFANPLKDLMLKGATFDEINRYISGGLFFAAVWIPIGLGAYALKIKKLQSLVKNKKNI